MINEIMRDLINERKVVVFVDNVLIGTNGEEEYDKIVAEVLKRLEENDLYVKPEKCSWKVNKVNCQDPWDNPGSPSEGMRLRRGELDRVPSMNCLAIYISTRGYAKTILREITVSISYHLSSPE